MNNDNEVKVNYRINDIIRRFCKNPLKFFSIKYMLKYSTHIEHI